MKLSDVITPGDKIDIKMLHEANQEDNGGEIAKIYQSAVSDIFSDQELEISMPTSGGRMVLFQLELSLIHILHRKIHREQIIIQTMPMDCQLHITMIPDRFPHRSRCFWC